MSPPLRHLLHPRNARDSLVALGRNPARATHGVAVALLALTLALAGCSSTPTEGGGALGKVLQAVGLEAPPAPAVPAVPPELAAEIAKLRAPVQLPLRIHAGDVLNIDTLGRSIPVVVRVYRLRNSAAFLQTPYETFQSDAAAKEAPYAKDVIDMREVVLRAGQKVETLETLPQDVKAIGLVAMFRNPASGRWRFAFDTKASAEAGVTVGVHGCALSVAQGRAIDADPDALRLAGLRCN